MQIDVRLEKETVWLNVAQMASLFDKEESNVRRHVQNAFKEGELHRDENNVHFLHVNGVKKPESKTEEKDVMVKVVVNLINQNNA